MGDAENDNFSKKTKGGSKNDRSKRFFHVIENQQQNEVLDADQLQGDEDVGEPAAKRMKGAQTKREYKCRLCCKKVYSNSDNLFVLTSHLRACHATEYTTYVDVKPNLLKQLVAKT